MATIHDHIHADLIHKFLGVDELADDAYGAGQCIWVSKDVIAAAGDVVAARSCVAGHADDDRFPAANLGHLVPDQITGQRRSARAIDPQQDGVDIVLGQAGLAQRLVS